MSQWIKSISVVLLSAAVMFWLAGCESETGTSTLIGAGIGAGAGQLIGGDTQSTVIGGAVGAGAGYAWEEWIKNDDGNGNGDYDEDGIVGNGDADGDLDDDVTVEGEEFRAAPDYSEDYGVNSENTVVVNITNTDGTTTPVRLVRQDDVWVGPRGEEYDVFPTEEELRNRYGF